MSGAGLQLTHDMVKFETSGTTEEVFLIGARIDEELGRLPKMVVEFVSRSEAISIDDLLGSKMAVNVGLGLMGASGFTTFRHFRGICVSVENLGFAHGCPTYFAEVRPWLWFLTRMGDNTIYNDLTVPEIIKQVMSDAGFTSFTDRLSGTYRKRGYTVQYNESHFDFISRLMEEEGIYYYFDYSGAVEKMVLADGISAHDNAAGKHEFKFDQPITGEKRDEDEIYDLSQSRAVTTGKVKLVDYDYLKPKADLKVTKAIAKGKHNYKNYQKFDMDGHYITFAEGEAYALSRTEHEAQEAETYRAEGNARTISCGSKIIIKGHQTVASLNALVKSTVFYAKTMIDREPPEIPGFKLRDSKIDFPAMGKPTYVQCRMQPDTVPFRPARTTPAPDLSGLHTAVVVGPDGDEIATDTHGRIQVRFHWMTDTQKSCWARVMAPWTGKGYGFYGVPRIGHEVVVQFERNNPDQPIVVGMIYNAVNNYPLPAAEVTKIGFKTRSSVGGSESNFNEFTMDDKKDAEMVTLQSEKDYTEIIKNNATITIGMEKADPGDLTQTIKHTKTETIKEGDFIQTVEKGNRTLKVKTNHDDTVEGTWSTKITGNTTFLVSQGTFGATVSKGAATATISQGNLGITVSQGHMATVVETGNSEVRVETGNHKLTVLTGHNTTTVSKGDNQLIVSKGHDNTTVSTGHKNTNVSTGNIRFKAGQGKINLDAAKQILLKVGQTAIKITPTAIEMRSTMIKVNGKMVKIEGTGMAELKGKLTTVKADALLTVKGGITMIN